MARGIRRSPMVADAIGGTSRLAGRPLGRPRRVRHHRRVVVVAPRRTVHPRCRRRRRAGGRCRARRTHASAIGGQGLCPSGGPAGGGAGVQGHARARRPVRGRVPDALARRTDPTDPRPRSHPGGRVEPALGAWNHHRRDRIPAGHRSGGGSGGRARAGGGPRPRMPRRPGGCGRFGAPAPHRHAAAAPGPADRQGLGDRRGPAQPSSRAGPPHCTSTAWLHRVPSTSRSA